MLFCFRLYTSGTIEMRNVEVAGYHKVTSNLTSTQTL